MTDQFQAVQELLKPYANHNAVYNSFERQQEYACICMEDTRKRILKEIEEWAKGDGPSVLWLFGPAGSGKSTIAHTVADRWDKDSKLAFSYFFSRRHYDRDNLLKFLPTFAYQLLKAFPPVAKHLHQSIQSNQAIFSRDIKEQLKVLIVEPLRQTSKEIPPMIVVIDGLDEYSEENGKIPFQVHLRTLIKGLVDMPFRFFFASRPDTRGICNELLTSSEIRVKDIPLRDYETLEEVRKYLRIELSRVQKVKGIPLPWPSEDDLSTLAKQSEGIFIYASTLVKFVGERYCDSREKLKYAMISHKGLDGLYAQVLDEANKHKHFSSTIGIILI
jgi:hypothetical protein